MGKEEDIQAILLADPIIAPLVGTRIYTSGLVGVNGLTYEATPEIFTAEGNLLTSLLIKLREEIADGQVDDHDPSPAQSSLQVAEIHGYEEYDYADLDIIFARARKILPIVILTGSFEMEWILTTGHLRDEAALSGASYVRQDWSISGIN